MKFSTKFIAASTEYSTFENSVPAPMFRRELTLSELESAELTICGLGLYELYINGSRITRGLLSSYIANPDDILYYDNYNLLPYLKSGKNVIGVILGNGMLNSFGGEIWDFQTARYRSAPKLALTFEATAKDGSKLEFDAADGFVCTDSPIILDDTRVGEFYDARINRDGWSTPEYDASDWCAPISAETPRGECRLCDVDPILPTKELAPVSIKPGKVSLNPNIRSNLPVVPIPDDEKREGYIYDFGVNAAGLCRLHIKNARPGQKIVMQFGEKLADDSGLDMRGMSFLPLRYNHVDIYICRGLEDEVYMPSFTYHGFQYCLVCGVDASQATPELLTYVVMNTSMKPRSEFTCSDEVANKLWDIIIVSDLANFYHFPTDCPHREKNGWTGDAALSSEQMITALTPERNWREWLNNIRASMNQDGAIPGIIPTSGWGFAWGNGPAWDQVLTDLPYFTWLYRGDATVAKENATAIFRYINYISLRRDDKGLVHIGLGDWCPAARDGRVQAPLEFTDTVVCMDICKKASKLYEVLGMTAQKAFADTIYNELRTSARRYLIDPYTLTALGRCQTTQAMAIFYDVFDPAEKPLAAEKLVKLIEEDGGSFTCGILGLRVIFHVLSAFGYSELAYHLITKPEFPSYGYEIACGATSLWEDFRLDEAAPNSRNHHFFGDIISWFMKNLVGINVNPHECDANELRFAPKFISSLDNAAGTYDAPAGRVEAEWKRDSDGIVYTVSLPDGARGELVAEAGWQLDDGTTFKRFNGKVAFRFIPADKPDKFKTVM